MKKATQNTLKLNNKTNQKITFYITNTALSLLHTSVTHAMHECEKSKQYFSFPVAFRTNHEKTEPRSML